MSTSNTLFFIGELHIQILSGLWNARFYLNHWHDVTSRRIVEQHNLKHKRTTLRKIHPAEKGVEALDRYKSSLSAKDDVCHKNEDGRLCKLLWIHYMDSRLSLKIASPRNAWRYSTSFFRSIPKTINRIIRADRFARWNIY